MFEEGEAPREAPEPAVPVHLGQIELIDSQVRVVVRNVLTIGAVIGLLYLVYLLRQPLGWLFMAALLAVTLSGPVNRLSKFVPRGLAIVLVYIGVMLIPVALATLVVPPVVEGATELADDAPGYADDVTEFVNENKTLRDLDEKYDISTKLEEEAGKLPDRIGDAAGLLQDIGFGVINSIFALVTILILSAFMVGSGQRWIDAALRLQPPERAQRLDRVLRRIAVAIRGYVAGALAIATIAGVLSYLVLWVLGVELRTPLAVMVGLFSLIPLIGATIAAVVVGLVTLFTDFPTATIIWTIWAVIYQQIENSVIQPQVQKRAVNVNAFVVLVAVLFGSTLFGVIGALVAIPVAASIQICIREYWDYRVEITHQDSGGGPPAPPPVPVEPAADDAEDAVGTSRRFRRRRKPGDGEEPGLAGGPEPEPAG